MSNWFSLFGRLAKLDKRILARWYLVNGAQPYMLIPSEERLDQDGIEGAFPYKLISHIEIPSKFEHGAKTQFVNDLDEVEALLKGFKGFEVARRNSSLFISPLELVSNATDEKAFSAIR
jgi:hypothetical protein